MRTARDVTRLAGAMLSLAVVAGACGPSTTVTASSASSASSASPVTSTSTGTASASGIGSAESPRPVASVTASAGPGASGVVVDADLLRVLPAAVDGVALEPDPATAAQIATDPTLAGSADAIAVALAIRPGTSSGDDLAIASVIRLRPGVFSSSWFETWRREYDQGACDVAGGRNGVPKEVVIAGRTVFVATCAGDAQTYHVHLTDPTLIVSITAAGPARFGELVMAGLAE